MSQRDIERLMALEKDIRKSGGPGCQYHADQLASIIAELGQEVGAVADTIGVLTVRRWRGIDAMVNHEFEYLGDLPDGTYSLFTSPAHASEARDAFGKHAGIYCPDSQRVSIVEQHEWPECGGFRNVWISYAEDAAMRQEAE